ncbi:MAG: hypothetical protein BWX70_01270 [Verrucomicrobia bacterium ADurb.Bin070]|nr:MAG: hypothetical protein BWX70_01270 [Verrucomicrobia bacterium ADurb.Bin070]
MLSTPSRMTVLPPYVLPSPVIVQRPGPSLIKPPGPFHPACMRSAPYSASPASLLTTSRRSVASTTPFTTSTAVKPAPSPTTVSEAASVPPSNVSVHPAGASFALRMRLLNVPLSTVTWPTLTGCAATRTLRRGNPSSSGTAGGGMTARAPGQFGKQPLSQQASLSQSSSPPGRKTACDTCASGSSSKRAVNVCCADTGSTERQALVSPDSTQPANRKPGRGSARKVTGTSRKYQPRHG